MKFKYAIVFAVIISFLISNSSCNKDEENTPVLLVAKAASEITETSFKANWTINTSEINSLTVEVSKDKEFTLISKSVAVSGVSQREQLVEGLNGASDYFFRIKCGLKDGSDKFSNSRKLTTSYKTELVNFITSDGYTLSASIKYLASNTSKNPGLIFMHELGVFVNNWKNSELITSLISQGYVCLVLDFRGHGQSDDFDLLEISEDLGKVAPDLIAAIDFLKKHSAVDPENLGLVGGSLGAIMAIAGNGFDEVKSTVSLSGARNGIYSIFQDLEIKSSFFICGELDNGGAVNFASEASKLYEIGKEPKKLKIIPGNSAHGTNLLIEKGLNQEIIDWINASFDKK